MFEINVCRLFLLHIVCICYYCVKRFHAYLCERYVGCSCTISVFDIGLQLVPWNVRKRFFCLFSRLFKGAVMCSVNYLQNSIQFVEATTEKSFEPSTLSLIGISLFVFLIYPNVSSTGWCLLRNYTLHLLHL